MYIPPHFEESRIEALHELILARPLATLVTLSSGGINANHIPLHLSPESGPFGILRGHVARANPMWSELVQDVETLAIFQGPNAYVSPSWYATKQPHGKVVPTWNYVAVHAYGTLRIIEDPAWLRLQLDAMTTQHEAVFPEPWTLTDAPREFTDRLIEAIVGIELVITKLTGKWKVSQNQPPQNLAGVIKGLKENEDRDALGMAALVGSFSHIDH